MDASRQLKARRRALIAAYARPTDAKGWQQIATTLPPMAALWVAALWSIHVSLWLTAALTLAIFFFLIRTFVLMHDCGHGSLFRSKRLNRGVGFVLGVISGMPQYVWAQHHDFHHKTNGDWDRYRGAMTTLAVEEYAALSAGGKRFYRGKCNMLIAPIAGFIYLIFNPRFNWIRGSIALAVHVARAKIREPHVSLRTHAAAFKTKLWASPRQYKHQTANNLVLLSAWALMCWLVGPSHFFPIYLTSLSMAGGAGMVLFTVQHNFEHAYASETRDWNADVGTLEGTSYMTFPRWLHWFTADIGYHHVHHISAAIPNYRLRDCHEANEDLFAGVKRIGLRELPFALSFILWDRRARRLISVAEYEQQQLAARPGLSSQAA